MSGYLEFDPKGASIAHVKEAEQLELLFAEFPYIGPLSVEGSPYILIDTERGECAVSCSKMFSRRPGYTVFIRTQGKGLESMPPVKAVQYLRENGAKSDWVK